MCQSSILDYGTTFYRNNIYMFKVLSVKLTTQRNKNFITFSKTTQIVTSFRKARNNNRVCTVVITQNNRLVLQNPPYNVPHKFSIQLCQPGVEHERASWYCKRRQCSILTEILCIVDTLCISHFGCAMWQEVSYFHDLNGFSLAVCFYGSGRVENIYS